MTAGPSQRTTVRREPERASYDPSTISSVLGDGLIAHVGIVSADGSPVVIPMAFAADGDSILLHGSVASRLMRTGSSVCVTVTIVDGWVVARSLFNSSMNYRSVVVLGFPEVLAGDEKYDALIKLSSSLLPGRVGHARGPSDKEIRVTTVWRLSLD
ncbi:MAG: pyridoxamine 5'-phosphate oxidase family protein, partial [Ilumatobacteraceae bacterium]